MGYTGSSGNLDLTIDSYNNIILSANNETESGPQWKFDANGSLTLPEGIGGTANVILPFDRSLNFVTTDLESGQAIVQITQNGTLNLPNQLYVGQNDFTFWNHDGHSAVTTGTGKNLELTIGGFANKVWTFYANGNSDRKSTRLNSSHT